MKEASLIKEGDSWSVAFDQYPFFFFSLVFDVTMHS